jgi:hypothetical protein
MGPVWVPNHDQQAMDVQSIIGTIKCRPHQFATSPEAFTHFAADCRNQKKGGQARIVFWDDIKDNPPPELKISLIVQYPTS